MHGKYSTSIQSELHLVQDPLFLAGNECPANGVWETPLLVIRVHMPGLPILRAVTTTCYTIKAKKVDLYAAHTCKTSTN